MTTSSFEQHDHLRKPDWALGGGRLVTISKRSRTSVRAAILTSPLSELTGFCLLVDCLNPSCAENFDESSNF
jgi:hypothetical protein